MCLSHRQWHLETSKKGLTTPRVIDGKGDNADPEDIVTEGKCIDSYLIIANILWEKQKCSLLVRIWRVEDMKEKLWGSYCVRCWPGTACMHGGWSLGWMVTSFKGEHFHLDCPPKLLDALKEKKNFAKVKCFTEFFAIINTRTQVSRQTKAEINIWTIECLCVLVIYLCDRSQFFYGC